MILPHILFYGGAGAGKTRLATVVKNELALIYGTQINFFEYTPAALDSVRAISRMISKVLVGDVVFIDEIHGLNKEIEECLYSVMQDFKLSSRGHSVKVDRFTLIGATTSIGGLAKPLIDRFPIQIELDPATTEDMIKMINDQANGCPEPEYLPQYHGQENAKMILKAHMYSLGEEKNFPITEETQRLIATRALGNPRIGKQILKHITAVQRLLKRSFTKEETEEWLDVLGIDKNGLHKSDRRVIDVLLNRDNKPLGVGALANMAGCTKADLELVIEHRLSYCGFLLRTPQGRALTDQAIEQYRVKTVFDELFSRIAEPCRPRRNLL